RRRPLRNLLTTICYPGSTPVAELHAEVRIGWRCRSEPILCGESLGLGGVGQRQFLESAQQDGDPRYVGYVLILMLGLRRGEVLGLPWSCVDLDRTEVTIGWQLQRIGGQLPHRKLRPRHRTRSSHYPICPPQRSAIIARGSSAGRLRRARPGMSTIW